jgi:hypothetical protein
MRAKYDIGSLIHPHINEEDRQECWRTLFDNKPLLRVVGAINELSKSQATGLPNTELYATDAYLRENTVGCYLTNIEGLSVFHVQHAGYADKKGSTLSVWKIPNPFTTTGWNSLVKGRSAAYVVKRLQMESSQCHINAMSAIRDIVGTIQGSLRNAIRSFVHVYTIPLSYSESNTKVHVPTLHALLDIALGSKSQVELSATSRASLTALHNSISSSMNKLNASASKVSSMFARDKWVLIPYRRTTGGNSKVLIGVFNARAAASEYSCTGAIESSSGVEITMPFRAYDSLDALPQEIKDELFPTLLMAKLNAAHLFAVRPENREHWQQEVDPDYLIPTTTHAVAEDMGVYLSDRVYMVDK